jgi:hypothetical protein
VIETPVVAVPVLGVTVVSSVDDLLHEYKAILKAIKLTGIITLFNLFILV